MTNPQIIVKSNYVSVPFTGRSSEELDALYKKHVKHPKGHWKGPAVAYVKPELVPAVTEAMDYFGSIVDSERLLKSGLVKLYSRGYWAHGF